MNLGWGVKGLIACGQIMGRKTMRWLRKQESGSRGKVESVSCLLISVPSLPHLTKNAAEL